MKGKRIYFFMTKEDLLSLSEECKKMNIKFYDCGHTHSKNGRLFMSLSDFPSLGINTIGEHRTEPFLVIPKDADIKLQEVQQYDGTISYHVDRINNENSVFFWQGGFYGHKYLIAGELSTISTTEISSQLYKSLRSKIKKICKNNCGLYWYSENVEKLVGVRLITINIKEPTEYDIHINN